MTTLITGGTGTLGRELVRQLADAGRPVRVLSRRPRPAGVTADWAVGDLLTGDGVEAALDGATEVIHCATDGLRAGADERAAGTLLAAAAAADRARPHLVYVSIVGIDRVPLRYYREKLAVEQRIERAGLPWTILRATQFHDLLASLLGGVAKLPVVPVVAGVSFQPVDVPEVAAQLVRLASGQPAGRAPDLGGPQVRSMAELARAYLRARGRRRPVVPVALPGAVVRSLRAGGNLVPEHPGGGRTWDEYLADTT